MEFISHNLTGKRKADRVYPQQVCGWSKLRGLGGTSDECATFRETLTGWRNGQRGNFKVQHSVIMQSAASQEGLPHAPVHADWLEDRLLNKIFMSWCTARWPWSSKAPLQQKVKMCDPSLLISTGEAAAGVLCPVLDSSAEERHQHPAASPPQSHKDYYETEIFFIWGKAERAGTVQPVEEGSGILPMCVNTWQKGIRTREPGSSQLVPNDMKRGNAHKLKQIKSHLNTRFIFFSFFFNFFFFILNCEYGQSQKHVTQRVWGVSVLGVITQLDRMLL